MQYQVFYGQHTTGHRQVWANDTFDKLVTDARGTRFHLLLAGKQAVLAGAE
jgi:hypothetical protein